MKADPYTYTTFTLTNPDTGAEQQYISADFNGTVKAFPADESNADFQEHRARLEAKPGRTRRSARSK